MLEEQTTNQAREGLQRKDNGSIMGSIMAKNASERAMFQLCAPLVSKPRSGRIVRLRWLTSASLIALALAFAPYRVSPDLHAGFIVANHAVADDDGGGDGGSGGDDGGSDGDGDGDGDSGGGDDGDSGGSEDGDSGDDDSGSSEHSGSGHASDTEDDQGGGDSDDGQSTGGVGFGGLN